MKALIVGLLSLTVLAGCATPMKVATVPLPTVLPAGQGFCKANDGIIAILINDKGETIKFVCPKIKGTKIRQEDKLDPDLVLIKDIDLDLGTAQKYGIKGKPDPCIDWVFGGNRYYICW